MVTLGFTNMDVKKNLFIAFVQIYTGAARYANTKANDARDAGLPPSLLKNLPYGK